MPNLLMAHGTVLLTRRKDSTVMMAVYDRGMKEDGRKLSKEQQIQARRRAMVLIGKNWRDQDVATAVGVNERTVRQWKQHRREHGSKSLWRDERGRAVGAGRTLTRSRRRKCAS